VQCPGVNATFSVIDQKIGAFVFAPYVHGGTDVSLEVYVGGEEQGCAEIRVCTTTPLVDCARGSGDTDFQISLKQHLHVSEEVRKAELFEYQQEQERNHWDAVEECSSTPLIYINSALSSSVATDEVRPVQGATIVRVDDRTLVVHGGVNAWNLFEPHSYTVDSRTLRRAPSTGSHRSLLLARKPQRRSS